MTGTRQLAIGILAAAVVVAAAAEARADPCAAVKREMTYGRVALKQATDKAGFLKSAAEFENAARKAPGCAEAHFNRGVVYEKAGEFAKARQAFTAYLKLAPGAADAAKVQEKIYELEYLAREGSASGGEKAAGWSAFAGRWCDAKSCDHPQWGRSIYDYKVTVTGAQIVIAREYRVHTGNNHATDQHAIFRGTIATDGKLRGRYSDGITPVTNKQCPGRTMEDSVDFSGELKKDTVIDEQGRDISGGVILLRWNGWTMHNHNYTSCTKYRASGGSWQFKNLLLKRRD